MGAERRRFIRIRDQLVVTYKLSSWKEPRRSLTRNISGAGLAFVVEDPLNEEAVLFGTVKLPDRAEPIPFSGKIIWARDSHAGLKAYELPKTQLGVEFVEIDEKDRMLVDVFARLNAAPDQD